MLFPFTSSPATNLHLHMLQSLMQGSSHLISNICALDQTQTTELHAFRSTIACTCGFWFANAWNWRWMRPSSSSARCSWWRRVISQWMCKEEKVSAHFHVALSRIGGGHPASW